MGPQADLRRAPAAPVTELSAVELAGRIRGRELSARAVVDAHITRLQGFAAATNALVADRYDLARVEADAVDAAIAGGEDLSARPLLGVPFTVKESIWLKGMPNATGLLARRGFRSSQTAPSVQRLIDAGAIPLGVTNTSELTLWIESANRLYGRTRNPYDPSRTSGGSSGGEGAAVGSGGSVFGIGSDIGGSIRLPAFFCGVFGHKPSPGLVPNAGMWPAAPADVDWMLTVGPLARRGSDLAPLLSVLSGRPPGDPASVSLDGVAVTVVEGTTTLPMSREVLRARDAAAAALVEAGGRLRTVSLRSWRQASLPFLATLQAGAPGATMALVAEGGEISPTLRSLFVRRSPHTVPLRITLATELLPQLPERARRRLIDAAQRLGNELLEAIGDGVLLHPAFPYVAPRNGTTLGRAWLMTPASVFNLARVPVTEVPLGLSRRGLPLGVQVAAPPGGDELAIAVALALERRFGGWVPPALKHDGGPSRNPRR